MTSSASIKPPEPSKLGDRIDHFAFFVWVLKTSYASAATLNFSSADLSPGFCQDDALMLSFYTLS
jgi:hypothetical protein